MEVVAPYLLYDMPKVQYRFQLPRENRRPLDERMRQLKGFAGLHPEDQDILLKAHLKKIEINPCNPQNEREFDDIQFRYQGKNPGLLGEEVPVADVPEFKITLNVVLMGT